MIMFVYKLYKKEKESTCIIKLQEMIFVVCISPLHTHDITCIRFSNDTEADGWTGTQVPGA